MIVKLSKKGFTIIEQFFIVLIIGILLTSGFTSGYKFYNNVKEKNISNQMRDIFNDLINSNDVGRGIEKDRIRKNTFLITNNTNLLHNYYYTEVYREDPITNITSSIPTIEFYGMEFVNIPDGILFRFPDTIEGTPLLEDDISGLRRLGIERVKPNNDIVLFDAHVDFFQQIDRLDREFFRSDLTFGKGYKDLFRGVFPITANFYYDRDRNNIGTEFIESIIDVEYRGMLLGQLVIDTRSNKIVYVDMRSENIDNEE